MKRHWLISLGLSLCFACTPASNGGTGGSRGSSSGGSGGSADPGGSGGSAGGSTGGTSGAGGSTGGAGGSSSTGGSGGSGSDTSGSGGSAAGGSGGSTGGSGGSASDASAPATDTGSAADSGGTAGGGPAAALDKFLFDVPCPAGTFKAAGNCTIPDAEARKKTKMVTFGGDPATTYMVKLHFCGPAEGRGYNGCMTSTENKVMCIDGTPMTGQYQVTYPTYSMAVAEPMHKYWLNNQYKADDIGKLDYSATVPIKGGTMIAFETDGGSNSDVYTAKTSKHNFMCDGVPGIMQPFEGQFVYVTVESVTPAN